MYKNISPVQSVSELQFVESYQSDIYFIPLNLETLLHCCIYKKQFLNPLKYLDYSFHAKALTDEHNFINVLPSYSKYVSIQSEIIAILRFYFNQIFFIEYLLNTIINNENISNIFVSGWNITTDLIYSNNNYFTSRIVVGLFGDRVTSIADVCRKTSPVVHDYNFKRFQQPQIIINAYGYNFNRLLKASNLRKVSVAALSFGNLKFRNKAISLIRGYNHLMFYTNIQPILTTSVESFSITLENKTKEKLFNERIIEIVPQFLTLLNKCRIIDKLLEYKPPSFLASWSMRGVDGYLLEKSHLLSIPSMVIPHGTIAPAMNKFDKMYKNNIAEAVFSGVCSFVALQSKITQNALKTNTIRGQPKLTGNLIFAEASQITKKHILYAVTLKSFYGLQYFGVEMYYEFLEDLTCLVNLQESIGLPVLVQLHPSARESKDSLQKLFPQLKFSSNNISTCLKNSILTISYSSTVIEDALYSKVPVILFDQWKRYQHCHAETDPSTENKAVYYVTDFEGLNEATRTVISSKNTEFSEYIVPQESSKNFDILIKEIF
jgi:hypothetical protein